ncbi:hypothetical protein EXIGLDRAFT_329364 [Exidia glandulosa HHB12029]|uniref:Zn(2)-C6 fungal-type domain-containing protein n=1 Tax=Exidia glandulosa HHB12029 TaxID=1314781 RepID=A0A165CT53_EXIGL|nr:hypothetical protein EXIGLDRAFT_329364 [Exidia glandulosa HHB12029]
MNTPADSVERGRGPNKTGRNASRARRSCVACRHRKIKCDEATPECGSCRSRGEVCDWSAEPDRRRTRTSTASFKQTIAHLTNQIGALKSRIERFKLRAASDDRSYTPSPPPSAVSTTSLGNGSSAHLPALFEGEREPPGLHSLGPDAMSAWSHHASTLSVSSASSFDVTSITSASQPISPRPTRPRLPFLAVTAPSMPIRQRPVSHSRARSDSILQHGRQRSPAPWKRANRSSSGPRSLVPDSGRQLLEIPVSQDLAFRSTTPEYYAFEFPSPGLGDDHDVGDEQEQDDDPFVVTSLGIPGKRLVTLKGEEGMAVTGNSPLALFSSPVASSNPPVSPSSSSPPTSSFLNMPFHLLSMTPIFSPTRNPSTVSTSPTRTYFEHDLLCNCDWDRHLPSDIRQHLTREDHDSALSQYFAHLTPWHFRVVPALFRRDMRIALSTPRGATHVSKTPHYSAGLHCAMLAEAGSLAPDGCILKQSSARDTLARTARNLIDDDCLRSVGTLASVTGLAVLAQYHLTIPGRAKFAFSLNGMAVRIARSTGLNFDTTAFVEEEERVDNQWCYLSLFVQDVDMSLHVGQEVTMPVPRFGFAPAPQYISNDAPLVGEVFAQTCALMVKAAQAVTVGFAVDKVSALDSDLRSWREHLPDRLTRAQATQQGASAHLLMLHITFHWIQIVAHRQFYAPSRYREESRRAILCIGARPDITLRLAFHVYNSPSCPQPPTSYTYFHAPSYCLYRCPPRSRSRRQGVLPRPVRPARTRPCRPDYQPRRCFESLAYHHGR